ncbi:NAD(P)-binding protein [Ganoderma leucocontextum]|nr:NAD(P)-binding protein [Ganoderma leucocontextum]
MASQKPLVLVVGATGITGRIITNALLTSGDFRVAAIIRPSSLSKPAVSDLRARGVEIRTGDINDGVESLKKTLEGADILVSAVVAWVISEQRDVIRAAKEVGVQRVVPCDFGTPGAKGVRALHDKKLAIREFVRELGVPHTFIDVGWWMQLYLPLPLRSTAPQGLKDMTWKIYGDGTARNLVTSNESIGKYVVRILADPRTLDQAVIVWEDEVSQEDAHALGERVSGEGDALKAKRIVTTKEDYVSAAAAAKEILAKDLNNKTAHVAQSWNEYLVSMLALGENTLENAKKLGYLDVRDLYPDIAPLSFEEYAKEFYSMEEPGIVFSRTD